MDFGVAKMSLRPAAAIRADLLPALEALAFFKGFSAVGVGAGWVAGVSRGSAGASVTTVVAVDAGGATSSSRRITLPCSE